MTRPGLVATLVIGSLLWAGAALSTPIDRAVVRFVALETGGVTAPRFIFERELAFEARIEALSDAGFDEDPGEPYRERHVQSALERHLAETLLENLPIDPEPTSAELSRRVEAVKLGLYQRVGGAGPFSEAALAEGIGSSEILRLFRRQARASLYLDRMVAPMLRPSDAELRQVHRVAHTPFSGEPFTAVREDLRRWYVALELEQALQAFYEGARSRLHVQILR
jgi:hypothetical protein